MDLATHDLYLPKTGASWMLSTSPRGTGPLGLYEKPEEYVRIGSLRIAADLPRAEHEKIALLRTDTPSFAAPVEARRNRRDDWYDVPAGHIDVCNVPLVTRAQP